MKTSQIVVELEMLREQLGSGTRFDLVVLDAINRLNELERDLNTANICATANADVAAAMTNEVKRADTRVAVAERHAATLGLAASFEFYIDTDDQLTWQKKSTVAPVATAAATYPDRKSWERYVRKERRQIRRLDRRRPPS